MFRLALAGVRHNTGRYIATLIAIMTGVAFFTATGLLGDRVIQSLEGDTRAQFENIDVAIVADDSDDSDESEISSDQQLRLPADVAEQLVVTDGIEASALVLSGSLALRNSSGEVVASDAVGRLWITDEPLNPVEVEQGRGPESSGEIAIDRGIADEQKLSVGDSTTLLSIAGEGAVDIVGITGFGDSDALDPSGTISVAAVDAFELLSGGIAEYEAVYLRGAGDQKGLVEAVESALPDGFVARTGAEFVDDQVNTFGQLGKILKQALQGFAVLALLVGAFVIYNTFSVLVAQRLKELAVLRAIGATPAQVRRALQFEGLVVGLIGSVLGIVSGAGLVFVLEVVLGLFGVELPGSGLVLSPNVVVQALLLGTIITVASVMVPAEKAASTEPIEALRDAAVESSPYTRKRLIFTIVMAAVGMLSLFVASGGVFLGVGLMSMFIATIAAGPILAVLAAKITRPVMSLLGLEGRLASDNTARNPARTATTANALLIGVFLVTLVSVAGASLRDYVVEEIKSIASADFLVESNGGSLDTELLDRLAAVDDVERVESFRRETVVLNGNPSLVSTVDIDAITGITDIKAAEGSLDDLGAGTIAVAEDDNTTIGEIVTIKIPAGEDLDLEVVALLEFGIDQAQVGSIIHIDDFDVLVGDTAPTVAFIDISSGAKTETIDALEAAIAVRPDLQLVDGNTLGKLVGTVFDFLINAVNGLLGMSVLIALIGIVNTLTLSIFERRRELGLLRVVGMLDKNVQRMVRLESVLISILGTLVGVALGLFSGWVLIRGIRNLSDADIAMNFALGRIGLVIASGVLLGVLASLLPSRRSTRLDVLDAIHSA